MQGIVQAVYHSAERLLKSPHFHDCHQIILILKGQVDFCVNGITTGAKAGDIAIFSRYENHAVHVRSEEYERFVLHIAPTVVNGESPVYSLLSDRPTGFCNVVCVLPYLQELVAIFKRLLDEQSNPGELADEMQRLTVKQLLILLYRCMPVSFAGGYDPVVMGIKRQFENDYNCCYTLAGLAKQYSISPSSLSHRFSAATGMSVMEYLLSCRMASAKQMLAGSDMGIGEIVERCGFSDNSNFSRTFKRLCGMAPKEFRKQYQAE